MNVQRILELAAHIEALDPSRFDIHVWSEDPADPDRHALTAGIIKHDCGTCACIGGWAETLFMPEDFNVSTDGSYINVAQLLGLSDDTAYNLCHPHDVSWSAVTKDVAVSVLRNLAETGQVDYQKALDQ